MTDENPNLPNLGHRKAHNEPRVGLHNSRPPTPAEHTVDTRPYLPGGSELRDLILARIRARSMTDRELVSALKADYCCRSQHGILEATASLINGGLLNTRNGLLTIREDHTTAMSTKPEPSQRERVFAALTDEPQTRSELSEATGLTPEQVSKSLYLLLSDGVAESEIGPPKRWWRVVPEEKAEAEAVAASEAPDEEASEPSNDTEMVPEYHDEWSDCAPWVVYDGETWGGFDAEADARLWAMARAASGVEAAVYRRFGGARIRTEWVPDE